MENPATGLLTKRAVLAGLPYLDITHCQHRARYMKATQLWGICPNFKPRHCRGQQREGWSGKHLERTQQYTHNLEMLHALPPQLRQAILASA
jgi:hypothetical protein